MRHHHFCKECGKQYDCWTLDCVPYLGEKFAACSVPCAMKINPTPDWWVEIWQ